MSTNARIASDALKYVTQRTEQLTTQQQKIDVSIEQQETEEATTSGIY
jgi:hypothetical protein